LRHNLLLAGLALTLAALTATSAAAQTNTNAPIPVTQAQMYGIPTPGARQDTNVQPTVPGKDKKGTPAVGERDTGVHKTEILSGPSRTVHYYANSGSPSEQALLNKLSQATR
jgi:hypothetical protein